MIPEPTPAEQEIIDLTKTMLEAWRSRYPGAFEKFFSYVHDDATFIGTGLDEIAHNKKMIEENERKGVKTIPEPVGIEYLSITAKVFGDTGVCRYFVNFIFYHEGQEMRIPDIRCTLVWVKEKGTWKYVHNHVSLPWYEQQEGDWLSVDQLKTRNRELERLVEEKTEALRVAKEEAEAANEAKSIFLSTMSHELRTPLTSIIGFTKLNKKNLENKVISQLQEDQDKARTSALRIKENLEVVKSESERLLYLINDLLDLAKIESGKVDWKIESVDPNQLIERASLATSSLFKAKPSLQLVKKELPNAPPLTVDGDRILQVLINLISNAIKFTDTGQVIIGIEQRETDQLTFFVQDTGPGIPTDQVTSIFERFHQIESNQGGKPKGTGLGLPICKEIVEHHGGRIWVESTFAEASADKSEPGKGSTFRFTLPIDRG